MRVKMESKKGKSAVCWIYQYSKKSLWLVILLALISGASVSDFIRCDDIRNIDGFFADYSADPGAVS